MSMTSETAGMTIIPSGAACGAEIRGVDPSQELSQPVVDAIAAAWRKHLVLYFRGYDLSLDRQLRFASRFGGLGLRKQAPDALRERTEGVLQTNEYTLLVSNMKVDGKPVGAFGEGDMWFHIDSGYSQRPYKYTFLHAIEIPKTGGNTLFANQYMAYDDLSAEMKAKIEGKKALHIHEYKRSEKVDLNQDISKIPHWFHPVAIRHPETGKRALFVDRLMTQRIEGMSLEESERTLNQLWDHAENPRYVYEHVWKLKDFVMWDNRCLTHGRTWFSPSENRLLRRCTVEGGTLSD